VPPEPECIQVSRPSAGCLRGFCFWLWHLLIQTKTAMRSTAVFALLLLALMAVHAVNADNDNQLSEIELEEASEIEQAANHWQFSPLVRLAIRARLSSRYFVQSSSSYRSTLLLCTRSRSSQIHWLVRPAGPLHVPLHVAPRFAERRLVVLRSLAMRPPSALLQSAQCERLPERPRPERQLLNAV
jgi:hypothetical protein